MRFSITSEFSARDKAWQDAYAAHDAFAEAGDDGTRCGGTKAADDASTAEQEALQALLLTPAVTPMEIHRKLEVIESRYADLSREDLENETDQMKRDLIAFFRPNASPAVEAAFTTWAEAHAAFYQRSGMPDEECSHLGDLVRTAKVALDDLPCTTPGDFIVKAYVELVGEYGASDMTPTGLVFLVPETEISHRADKTKLRDILDTDLGCCMAALGRTDFDAARWIAVAKLIGKTAHLVLSDPDKERAISKSGRSLSFGLDGEGPLADLLQRLTANGLREVSSQRCKAIADEIEANHPDLVVDYRRAIAA